MRKLITNKDQKYLTFDPFQDSRFRMIIKIFLFDQWKFKTRLKSPHNDHFVDDYIWMSCQVASKMLEPK